MTKIEELRTLLNNMHIPARINTGAWWRGVCPLECKACQALTILNELHPVAVSSNPCAICGEDETHPVHLISDITKSYPHLLERYHGFQSSTVTQGV